MSALDLAVPSPLAPRPIELAVRRAGGLFGRVATRSIQRALTRRPFGAVESALALREELRFLLDLHNIQVNVEGRLPATPAILVANHLSYLDPVILGSVVPCAPIAKAELAGWPVLGGAARRFGVIFVQRGDPWSGARALLRAAKALRGGASVLAFPEGTTTRGNTVLRFRWGVFGLARRLGVPIVPVRLDFEQTELAWVGGQLFLPHYLRTAARPVTRVRARFLDPIQTRPRDEPRLLAAQARWLIWRAR